MRTPSSGFPLSLAGLQTKLPFKRASYPIAERDFCRWQALDDKRYKHHHPNLVHLVPDPVPFVDAQALYELYPKHYDIFIKLAKRSILHELYSFDGVGLSVVDALYFAAWLRGQKDYSPKLMDPLYVLLNGGKYLSRLGDSMKARTHWGIIRLELQSDTSYPSISSTLDPYELNPIPDTQPWSDRPFIEIAFANDTPSGKGRYHYGSVGNDPLNIMAEDMNRVTRHGVSQATANKMYVYRKEDFAFQFWKPYVRLAARQPVFREGLMEIKANDHFDAPQYWYPENYWLIPPPINDRPPPPAEPWEVYYEFTKRLGFERDNRSRDERAEDSMAERKREHAQRFAPPDPFDFL